MNNDSLKRIQKLTKEKITVAASRVPSFKAAKALKETVKK